MDAILALLAEDATFAMPPYAGWCRGREAVADSLAHAEPARGRAALPRRPARTASRRSPPTARPDNRRYLPIALDVLTLRGDRIESVLAFRGPEVFAGFELSVEIPAGL